ncbi:nucleotidyltransferase family protein [Altererythrobacter aquiaggeris]|uniref:nucleotidyltransferase domain-containing protein n=1 Tax=Aestuarierythrobacter aquiaggeris TaxID=1898396 RepID=UPI003015E5D2
MAAPELTGPAQIRRLLMGLLGPQANAAAPDSRQWDLLSSLAGEHRLQPHLHGRLSRGELTVLPPPGIAATWEAAHRRSAISALAHRAELMRLTDILSGAGIAPTALKGAWLAWYAYPSPAERPVRDIDLLIAPNQVLAAFELLLDAGYMQAEPSAKPAAEMVKSAKHLPPLESPGGIRLELHMRCWETQAAFESFVPANDDPGIRERASKGARATDPVKYPSPRDMLDHLIIHAAYSHQLDVGPLLLSDLNYLVRSTAVDWQQLWARAENGGWENGAALIIAALDRWRIPGLLDHSGCRIAVPPSLIDAVPDLLLQSRATRKSAGLMAALGGANHEGGTAMMGKRALDRLGGRGRPAGQPYWQWLFGRTGRTLAQLTDRETRRTGLKLVQLNNWLNHSAGQSRRDTLPVTAIPLDTASVQNLSHSHEDTDDRT